MLCFIDPPKKRPKKQRAGKNCPYFIALLYDHLCLAVCLSSSLYIDVLYALLSVLDN